MRVEELPLVDEGIMSLVLPKKRGTCSAGFLFWPCFRIKMLLLWDAPAHIINSVAEQLYPDFEKDDTGSYAWVWDMEDAYGGEHVPAEEYVSACDLPVGHILCVTKRPKTDWVGIVGAIAHEAQHVTISAFKYRGIKLVPESEEAYTYQTESIIERVLQMIKRKPKKRILI